MPNALSQSVILTISETEINSFYAVLEKYCVIPFLHFYTFYKKIVVMWVSTYFWLMRISTPEREQKKKYHSIPYRLKLSGVDIRLNGRNKTVTWYILKFCKNKLHFIDTLVWPLLMITELNLYSLLLRKNTKFALIITYQVSVSFWIWKSLTN